MSFSEFWQLKAGQEPRSRGIFELPVGIFVQSPCAPGLPLPIEREVLAPDTVFEACGTHVEASHGNVTSGQANVTVRQVLSVACEYPRLPNVLGFSGLGCNARRPTSRRGSTPCRRSHEAL